MKFYFAGAIRGGREKLDIYMKINELLEQYGEILDKHVANPNVNNHPNIPPQWRDFY